MRPSQSGESDVTAADVTDLQAQITAIQTDLATLDFEKADASTVGGVVTRANAIEERVDALETVLPGLKGPTGDKGEAGDKGATGDKGPAGDKGATGDKGSLGDKGATGDKGVTGDAGSVSMANPQFTGTAFFAQPTPTTKSATATLTVAELLTLIIITTGATAKSFTLPTGTLMDAGLLSGALAVNQAFEWYLINTGTSSGASTLVAGTGHTIVGAALVAIGTTGRFLTRKTTANTFVTYRIG